MSYKLVKGRDLKQGQRVELVAGTEVVKGDRPSFLVTDQTDKRGNKLLVGAKGKTAYASADSLFTYYDTKASRPVAPSIF